jgi:hypothetical protein
LLVVAAGQNRRICQLTASGLDCSVLPVKGGEFDRLWFDDGTLWLSTNKDQSYTSPLAGTLNWTPVAAAITDLRSVRAGGEPVAMIASGIEGIFASRTPQDRGSWCEVSRDGLNGNRVVKSISNPAGSDYLHIAVAGVGFYRASLEDLAAELARNCL